MSIPSGEPGTRLGGRFRLEDRVSDGRGWAAWKAIDETLARPVAVLTFARGFPRIGAAMTGARAASRLTDARLAQVFDLEEDRDRAYLVTEWVPGDSLQDLLADGPLDPSQSAEIIAQGAEALAAAHAGGVAHLCLTPGSLRWAPDRGVKICGVGIAAALVGVTAGDPALADTRGLGNLLYAALTAHWPGGECPPQPLPPAPQAHGHPCSPRAVRAGVPAGINEVTCRVLFGPRHTGSPAVSTPAMLAAALHRVIPALPAPGRKSGWPPAGRGGPDQAPAKDATRTFPPMFVPLPPERQRDHPHRRRAAPGGAAIPIRGPSGTGVLAVVIAVLAMAALAVVITVLATAALAAVVSMLGQQSPGPVARALLSPQSPPSSLVGVLTPVSAAAFGPSGGDNLAQAGLAIDGKSATDWTTDSYRGSPHFGNLYDGTGLILNMGQRVRVASVTVTFGQVPGGRVRVEVGSSDAGSAPAGFTTLARTSNATGTVTFTGQHPATGQFVLIWFTRLPSQAGSPDFQAAVFNVVVRAYDRATQSSTGEIWLSH
jgi:hypothetical protein